MNKMNSNFYANFSRETILRFRFVDPISELGVNKVTSELEKVINAFNLNYNQTISDTDTKRNYVYPIIEETLTNDEYAFLVMMVLQYLQHQYFSCIPTMHACHMTDKCKTLFYMEGEGIRGYFNLNGYTNRWDYIPDTEKSLNELIYLDYCKLSFMLTEDMIRESYIPKDEKESKILKILFLLINRTIDDYSIYYDKSTEMEFRKIATELYSCISTTRNARFLLNENILEIIG